MNDLKNILKLAGICLWALAAIGGVGYCAYYHHYLIAASILFLAVLSFPTVKSWWPKASNASQKAAKETTKKAAK